MKCMWIISYTHTHSTHTLSAKIHTSSSECDRILTFRRSRFVCTRLQHVRVSVPQSHDFHLKVFTFLILIDMTIIKFDNRIFRTFGFILQPIFNRHCLATTVRHFVISSVCSFNMLNILRQSIESFISISKRSVWIDRLSNEHVRFATFLTRKKTPSIELHLCREKSSFWWFRVATKMKTNQPIEIGSVCRTKNGIPVYYKVGKL